MLPKINRLTVFSFHHSSPKIYIKKKTHLAIYLIKQSETLESNPKFAFIVPKSLDKRSVYRHKTKRFYEECVRFLIPFMKKNIRLIITPLKLIKPDSKNTLTLELIKKDLNTLGLLE